MLPTALRLTNRLRTGHRLPLGALHVTVTFEPLGTCLSSSRVSRVDFAVRPLKTKLNVTFGRRFGLTVYCVVWVDVFPALSDEVTVKALAPSEPVSMFAPTGTGPAHDRTPEALV